MRDAYINCLNPRALQWNMFTDFLERKNYKTGNNLLHLSF